MNLKNLAPIMRFLVAAMISSCNRYSLCALPQFPKLKDGLQSRDEVSGEWDDRGSGMSIPPSNRSVPLVITEPSISFGG